MATRVSSAFKDRKLFVDNPAFQRGTETRSSIPGIAAPSSPSHPPVAGGGGGDILATAAAGPAAARGGALRVGGYLVGVLAGALSAALLFRHLGRDNTGLYVTAGSLVAIVGAFSDLGLTAVGVREISTLPPDEGWAIARDLLGLRITLTLLGGIVVVVVAWFAYSATLAAGVALAAVGLLLQATQDNFAVPLTVGLRLGWVAALDLTRQLLTALMTILLVLLGASLVPFLGISIPVGVVVLFVTFVLVRGVRSLAPAFDARRWWRLVGKMIPFAVAVAASALYLRVAIILVSAFSDPAQLGYFGASFRIVEVLTVVPALLASSAFPIFARAAESDHERLGYGLGKVFEVSLIVGAWVAVSIAVGAPLAIALIGGPKFAAATPVLAIQGVTVGAMFVSLVWANGLLSLGLYRKIMVINLLALTGNAVLVTLLVIADGARGAAIGTAIAEIAVGIVQAVVVVRGRPQLRPSLRVVPVVLASALGLLPLALTGLPDIVRLCLSTLLFGGCLLATRAIPREALDLLPRLGAGGRRGGRG